MTQLASFAASTRGVDLQRRLNGSLNTIIDEAIRVQQIPAPTFDEARRAHYVQTEFERYGLADVALDEVFNVYGRLPGRAPDHPAHPSALCISAHTDTVFALHTDLTAKREPNRVSAPGIGDNSLAVAALLGLIRLLQGVPLGRDIWFVANTREEGLGDLGGIRAAIQRLDRQIDTCIVLEGMAYGQIYNAGIAVRRLKISTSTSGGHSWLHFGQPSAIHALVRFAARLTDLRPPTTPRTSYNIGLIEGGQSVNTIASEASLTLDMRSEDSATLAALEQAVMNALDLSQSAGVEFKTQVVGDRPAGSIPPDHPLVLAAKDALAITDTQGVLHTGSTDANYPLSRGIPAITVGITSGGNAHRIDEYIDLPPIARGMWQLTLLALTASRSI